jgi:hypothetical protein
VFSQGIKKTQGKLERLVKEMEETHKRTEVAIKNLEVQMGQLSAEFANATTT